MFYSLARPVDLLTSYVRNPLVFGGVIILQWFSHVLGVGVTTLPQQHMAGRHSTHRIVLRCKELCEYSMLTACRNR